MELLAPWWLLGIPIIGIILWLIGRNSLHPMSASRRRIAIVTRTICVVCACLYLSIPLIRVQVEQQVVVFIIDHSKSMGDKAWQSSLENIATIQASFPSHVHSALVSTGETPVVLRSLEQSPIGKTFERPASRDNTDLSAAIRLASGLCPPHAQSRLLIIGDGWETRGDAIEAARRAASHNIHIDCLPLAGEAKSDVRVVGLQSSHSRLHQGATLELAAELISSLKGTGVARLYENGIEVAAREIEVEQGQRQRVVFNRHPDKRGIYTYRIRIDGFEKDEIIANNQGLAFVDVRGKPLLLLLSNDFREAKHFQKAMYREGVDIVLRKPTNMPQSLPELIGYDGVIVGNIPANELGEARMILLRDYVEQLGGGLVMIGGDQSFGAGGYYRTPIEEVLPVKMRAKDKEERRPTCLMLVLDRSGSMGGQKMTLCKQAAKATAQLLRNKDFIGVIAFDSSPHWVVPMGRMSPAAIVGIDSVNAGGGTSIYPAMEAAYQAMHQVRAGSKHMIVLTDGHGGGGDFANLSTRIQSSGISISTVAVGSGADVGLLQLIAQHGKGSCYQSADPSQLKAIFTQDTMKHLGKILREEPFIPVVAEQHPMLKGWSDDAPALLGYVKTEPKALSQIPLVTDLGDPLLAYWRFGLGKVTAFTSGSGSRWAPLWIAGWGGYGRFWAQVLRDTARVPQGQFIDVHAHIKDDKAIIDVDLLENAASFEHNAEVNAVIHYLPSHNLGSSLNSGKALTCHQVAPGRYRSDFPLEESGIYIVQVQSGSNIASAGLVHVPSTESATGVVNKSNLEHIAHAAHGVLLDDQTSLPALDKAQSSVQRINLQNIILVILLCVFFVDICIRRWDHVLGLMDNAKALVGK